MTDYVLTATYFDQAVERDEKGLPTKVVKHYQGAVISDLDEAEAVRLLACGAVAVAEVQSAPAKPKRARRSRKSTATAGKESDQSNTDEDGDSDDGGDDLDGLDGDEGDDDSSGDDEGATGDGDAPAAPKGILPKPPNTADLELWVAYAVDQGLNEDEAKGMDRAALIKALA